MKKTSCSGRKKTQKDEITIIIKNNKTILEKTKIVKIFQLNFENMVDGLKIFKELIDPIVNSMKIISAFLKSQRSILGIIFSLKMQVLI